MISDTSFQKKCVRWAFRGLILGVLLILTPFFIVEVVEAFNYYWKETFEGYSVGLLSDNPKWSDLPSNFYFVSDDEGDVLSGEKAGKVETYGDEFPEIIFNPNSDVNSGIKYYQFSLKPRYWTSGFYGYLKFRFIDTDGDWFMAGLQNERDKSDVFNVILAGYFFDCETFDPIGYSDPEKIGEISKENWITFHLRADFDNKMIRITSDEVEGQWCMWFKAERTASILTKLELRSFKTKIAFDDFEEKGICELGGCQYCEIYETCIEAGCFWYYSFYGCQIGQCYSCVEPYEPEPEECGAFYQCQYCMTQETCEEQLNCEWVDRGLGFKCYMKEPQMPPEQVAWEVPELEDCSELSGVEKWLCEIKNFVAGIFMPSQEKIDILYQTFANFKERFPFNYIGSMNFFFSDVRNSLDQEKNIPVKILGQQGDVSFGFWDKTTTIGGISETFKDIVKDFTTFIVFLGWFLWLISFLQRFF